MGGMLDSTADISVQLDPMRNYSVVKAQGSVRLSQLAIEAAVFVGMDKSGLLPAWTFETVKSISESSAQVRHAEGYTVFTVLDLRQGELMPSLVAGGLDARSFLDLERDIMVYKGGADNSERFVETLFSPDVEHPMVVEAEPIFRRPVWVMLLLLGIVIVAAIVSRIANKATR